MASLKMKGSLKMGVCVCVLITGATLHAFWIHSIAGDLIASVTIPFAFVMYAAAHFICV